MSCLSCLLNEVRDATPEQILTKVSRQMWTSISFTAHIFLPRLSQATRLLTSAFPRSDLYPEPPSHAQSLSLLHFNVPPSLPSGLLILPDPRHGSQLWHSYHAGFMGCFPHRVSGIIHCHCTQSSYVMCTLAGTISYVPMDLWRCMSMGQSLD